MVVAGKQESRGNTVVAAGAPGQPGVDQRDCVAFPDTATALLLGVRDGDGEGVDDEDIAPPMQDHWNET